MRRNWIPKKVLSVIMAAALSMSPTLTAVASPVDDSVEATQPELSVESDSDAKEETSTEETSQEKTSTEESSTEEVVDENQSEDKSEEKSEEAAEKSEAVEDVEAPTFEEIDPQEEGLINQAEQLAGEGIEDKVETTNPEEETRVII